MKKNPNLKYKSDIIIGNELRGANDIFEVFTSYKDKNVYIILPNIYNLDIFEILNNNKISSLIGHNCNITIIRYFINKKNYNEYLISGDIDKIIIIWDINKDYEKKYIINTKYGSKNYIFSCLLVFPHYYNENYIITSCCNATGDYVKSSTKIFSLNNGKYIQYIKGTHNFSVFYLLQWHNKKDDIYYIVQLGIDDIFINGLLENDNYINFKEYLSRFYCGFIYSKEDIDYLYTITEEGNINIYDLYKKQIFQQIKIKNSNLKYIIEWNYKYILVADYHEDSNSIKIIDSNSYKIISNIKVKNNRSIKCIKKIYHPIYRESLLSVGDDGIIKLWTI